MLLFTGSKIYGKEEGYSNCKLVFSFTKELEQNLGFFNVHIQ